MLKYIVKRLLLGLLILFGVSVIIYTLVRLMPADYVDRTYASKLAQGEIDSEALARMKALFGLEDNSFKGILRGYFNWLGKLVRGDLGESFIYKKPVSEAIFQYMWTSFFVAFVAMFFQFLIAIPLGVTAATHQYSVRDYAVTVFTMIGISLPSFFFAAILIKVFAVDLGWFPIQGAGNASLTSSSEITYFFDNMHHMVLPILTLIVINIGSLMRYTRTNTLEVLSADYIRTARAKGLKESKVIYKHAFRNTLIPLVTLLAGTLPTLFSGAMITEQVFAIEGVGNMAYKAQQNGDIPFVMGYTMFIAILSVIGTLLADLMYAVVDPRVKLQ